MSPLDDGMTTGRAPDTGAAIAILRSQSLTALVQREIEHRILAGRLGPGAKLNEAEIAGELSVSRGPVREAFRALEQAGPVRTGKNRGVFVREVSLREADEIYEVRSGLEALVGRLAAERAGKAQVAELREMIARMRTVGRTCDVDAYYPLNLRFHDRLAELAGNATLLAAYRTLINQLHLYRRETLAHGRNAFAVSTREHAAVVDAIAARDPATASRLMQEHVVGSRHRLHGALESGPPAAIPRPDRKGVRP